jgi:Rha family phage regulatory protein
MNQTAQLTLALPNPLAAREVLFLSTDGQPFTTSRSVADRFGKLHKNVLRDIENLLADMPDPEFSRLNFEPVMYESKQGKGAVQMRPEYRLTHDGFALLAMGFTGRDALAWKVAFLQAFNQMEAELHRLQGAKAHALDVLRPCLQPVIDGERVGANRALIARYMGKSLGAVSYHRRVARRLGLLGAAA